MPDQNLLKVSNFFLEIGGLLVAGFSKATIGERTVQVAKYRNGNDPPVMTNIAGLIEFGPLVLERGMTFDEPSSLELANWNKDVIDGKIEKSKKNISVIIKAQDLFTPAVRFNIIKALPTKYSISPLDSKTNEVVIEKIEIVHEGIDVVKG